MKKVVVFGIFDGIHDGHRALFVQARRYGDELVAIVGRDEICRKLKNKTPQFSQEERVRLVEAEPLVDKAVLGDAILSSYSVLEEIAPDVVCLGYDQDELEADLRLRLAEQGKQIELRRAKPYRECIFHNSFIHRS